MSVKQTAEKIDQIEQLAESLDLTREAKHVLVTEIPPEEIKALVDAVAATVEDITAVPPTIRDVDQLPVRAMDDIEKMIGRAELLASANSEWLSEEKIAEFREKVEANKAKFFRRYFERIQERLNRRVLEARDKKLSLKIRHNKIREALSLAADQVVSFDQRYHEDESMKDLAALMYVNFFKEIGKDFWLQRLGRNKVWRGKENEEPGSFV